MRHKRHAQSQHPTWRTSVLNLPACGFWFYPYLCSTDSLKEMLQSGLHGHENACFLQTLATQIR